MQVKISLYGTVGVTGAVAADYLDSYPHNAVVRLAQGLVAVKAASRPGVHHTEREH
jgi:hypothetical protein